MKVSYVITYFILAASFVGCNGDQDKVGHINTIELWELIPQKASADSVLARMGADLTLEFTQKKKIYENLIAEIKRDTIIIQSPEIQQKLDEAVELQDELKALKELGDEKLIAKRDELYKPIREHMEETIEQVADENGYTYVFDASFGNIVYVKDETDDLMPLVKRKLGVLQ